MVWYWETENGIKEAAELREAFPTLNFRLDHEEHSASVEGILPISGNLGYSVHLELPINYPTGIPILRIDPKEISWISDRHINEKNGEACLCVRSEYRVHWPPGSSIAIFIERLVRPYFAAQLYYDAHRSWPVNAARSHGRDGILEAYKELSLPLGDTSLGTIEKLMRLLARRDNPKGHEPCPCGSSLRLRNCHSEVLKQLRKSISSEHARVDLETVFPSK